MFCLQAHTARISSSGCFPISPCIGSKPKGDAVTFLDQRKPFAGLGSINSREVRSAPIPLPPLDVQRVQTGSAEITHLRAKAERVHRAVRAEIEELILGTQRVTGD
jgi:hypothetical protein